MLAFSVQMAAQKSPSEQLFEAAITRYVPADNYVWNWRDAVLLKSFIDISRSDPDKRDVIADYAFEAMIRMTERAHGYHPNGIASAVGLAFLQEIDRNTPQIDETLKRVLAQSETIVRAPNGACSHRKTTLELWDDTVYMLGIALIGCYNATGDLSYVERFAQEIVSHAHYLMDNESGLWYHGWAETSFPTEDNCCQYGWNTNPEHRNREFWGRGNGWIAMSMADVLEVLPESDFRYPQIKDMFVRMMATLAKVQDGKTALWRQLPIHVKDNANFLESSCTAMFGYAAAKGVRLGVLPAKYNKVAQKAYDGIVVHCLTGLDTEKVGLSRICAGTCIGDKEYYYARRQVDFGETYALGAVLMLANELKINN